jgi:hypothetical protein
MSPRSAAGRRPLVGSPFATDPPPTSADPVLPPATRVLHDRHGMGIVHTDDEGPTTVVDFGSGGLRRVRRASLTVL